MEAAGPSDERCECVEGLKAEESTFAIVAADQMVVMLSGKSGVSRTRMSVGERRPSWRALVVSSLVRVGPRPSALPEEYRVSTSI